MNNTPDQSTSPEPFTYVIIPLIAIFVIGSIATIFHLRRRRRLDAEYRMWPRGRMTAPDGHVIYVSRFRRNPWGGTRSEEGLNELGEAPPPYERKKTMAATAGENSEAELRDLEEGRRPPEYVAEPPPAVTTDSRRGEL